MDTVRDTHKGGPQESNPMTDDHRKHQGDEKRPERPPRREPGPLREEREKRSGYPPDTIDKVEKREPSRPQREDKKR
jgi:hypothetical protein